MACVELRDYHQAIERFEKHVAEGREVGIDTFNLLFKVALSSGSFQHHGAKIGDMIAERASDVVPDGATETILRGAGGGAYSAERDVADDLLRRFGFEDEIGRQQEYRTLLEMGYDDGNRHRSSGYGVGDKGDGGGGGGGARGEGGDPDERYEAYDEVRENDFYDAGYGGEDDGVGGVGVLGADEGVDGDRAEGGGVKACAGKGEKKEGRRWSKKTE